MKSSIVYVSLMLTSFQTPPMYYPLVPESYWIYKTSDGTYEERFDGKKFSHKNIDYLQCTRKYSDGTAEVYFYRIDKNGAVINLDNETFEESTELPANPRISFRWTSSDLKWEYRIVEINADLSTPVHLFRECIAIEAQMDGNKDYKYVNYYCKGIGFVGSKVNGKLEVYLTKWNLGGRKS